MSIEKNISKEDFLRNIFIKLSPSGWVPLNFLSAKFGEVSEGEETFYYVTKTYSGYRNITEWGESEMRVTTKNAYVQAGSLYTYDGAQYYADKSGYKLIDAVEEVPTIKRKYKSCIETETLGMFLMTKSISFAGNVEKVLLGYDEVKSQLQPIDYKSVFSAKEMKEIEKELDELYKSKLVDGWSATLQVYKITLPVYKVKFTFLHCEGNIIGVALDSIPAYHIDWPCYKFEYPTTPNDIPRVSSFMTLTLKAPHFYGWQRKWLEKHKGFCVKNIGAFLMLDNIEKYKLREPDAEELQKLTGFEKYTEKQKRILRRFLRYYERMIMAKVEKPKNDYLWIHYKKAFKRNKGKIV